MVIHFPGLVPSTSKTSAIISVFFFFFNSNLRPYMEDTMSSSLKSHSDTIYWVCLVIQLCLTALQAPLCIGILRARILEWVAMPSSGDLINPGTEPRSPALQVDSLPAELLGKSQHILNVLWYLQNGCWLVLPQYVLVRLSIHQFTFTKKYYMKR